MTKLAVLIVDDSEEDRYLLSRQLRETDLIVHIFEENDGVKALNFFKEYEINRPNFPNEYPPQVIFLDINMPLLDGYGFLEEYVKLKQDIKGISSVVLMYSSSDENAEKEKAFQYDCVKGYLVKGNFTTAELKDRLLKIVGSKNR